MALSAWSSSSKSDKNMPDTQTWRWYSNKTIYISFSLWRLYLWKINKVEISSKW
jgi:hypothetical protein